MEETQHIEKKSVRVIMGTCLPSVRLREAGPDRQG